MADHRTTFVRTEELGGAVIAVSYSFSPGRPAYISGPAEDCYPAEDPELEILRTTAADGAAVELTAEELKELEIQIFEDPPEGGPDPDDLRDQAIEDRLL